MLLPGVKQDNIYLALLLLLKWQSVSTMRGICGSAGLDQKKVVYW